MAEHQTSPKSPPPKPTSSPPTKTPPKLKRNKVIDKPSSRTPPDRYECDNVWQVDATNYEMRRTLSPIESVQESNSSNSATTTKSDIDSTSFIILRDDVDLSKDALLRNGVTKLKSQPPADSSEIPKNVLSPKSSPKLTTKTPPSVRDRCADCCFCNPNLHGSVTSCSYCQARRSTAEPQKSQDTKSTNTSNQFYEILSKTDHTHVRTKSKESDTVSLKCTKTNSKMRRFIPEEDLLNGNDNEDVEETQRRLPPKVPTSSPKVDKVRKQDVRLPSPFVAKVSSSSYDSVTTSSCSSASSTSPSSPSKKCPPLPVARWQQKSSPTAKPPRASRYQSFYGDKGPPADVMAAPNGAGGGGGGSGGEMAKTIQQSSGESNIPGGM